MGQPNNENNTQHCVMVEVNETHAFLDDENCETKFRYVCEVGIDIILMQQALNLFLNVPYTIIELIED